MRRLTRFCSTSAFVGMIVLAGASVTAQDRRTSDQEPMGLAPDPATTREAVVQVYGARTLGLKGLFGVHTWIAVKPQDAPEYTVYEIIGWRLRWSDTALVVRNRAPDARWFGAEPELYAEKRGAGVDDLIRRIEQAVRDYPYANTYTVWPGPNSNTFVAWIARAVPELAVDLPATAIGKDYIGGNMISTGPSGSGFQFSLRGLLGVTASEVEGVEFNFLSLNFGVGPSGVKLPMVGRIGSARIDPVVPKAETAIAAGAPQTDAINP